MKGMTSLLCFISYVDFYDISGRFLAELTGEVFADLEANKYQFAEYRLSIYGRNKEEWGRLGKAHLSYFLSGIVLFFKRLGTMEMYLAELTNICFQIS